MKKLIFVFLLAPLFLHAQISLNMGGASFVNCKQVLAFGQQEIVSVHKSANGSLLLNADVYNEAGGLVASVRDNQTEATNVILSQNNNVLLLTDKFTKRTICSFTTRSNVKGKIELDVALNVYLPNGRMFECTPSTSNHAPLEILHGTTMKDLAVAVKI